jgi:deoxyribonuclease-4
MRQLGLAMVKIGVHVSIAGGIDKAVGRAQNLGCDVFQIFSHSPRGWGMKDISEAEAKRFVEKLQAAGIGPVFDHMPYLPNLASPKEDIFEESVTSLSAELKRCEMLRIPYLVTHLGSHLGSGWEEGAKRIVAAIKRSISEVDSDVILLLENTAGTKNSMGSTFNEIATIIESSGKRRLGICLDTCHAFAAGYDLRDERGLRETLKELDDAALLDMLKLIHLNDSKGALRSRLDRHEHIGMGEIGARGFRAILHNEHLRKLPMVMETPVDSRRDDLGNLTVVRDLASE